MGFYPFEKFKMIQSWVQNFVFAGFAC
jgi:hypothetical protein